MSVVSDDPELRSKLDTASMMPRGRWKALWEAAAAEFALPAREFVERILEDSSNDGVAAADTWLLNPEGAPPLLPWGAWKDALDGWKTLDPEGGRAELRQRAKAVVKAMQASPDAERVLPLLIAGIGPINWRVSFPLSRARWLDAHPLGPAAAVACLKNSDFHENTMRALGNVRGLPVEARGAMWLVTWSDPQRVAPDYLDYARLGEPAAIASILHDSLLSGWDDTLPTRPALTRALCRIIMREDPWLEPKWSEENYDRQPLGPIVLQRALAILPRVAEETGCEAIAKESLDPRWQQLGFEGAVARGKLRCADAVPALISALAGDTSERALEALARIGPAANSALEAIRAAPESRERTLAIASIDGSPATLEALFPLCELVLERATEIRMHYEEGLITADEYARKFDPAAEAVRMWIAAGLTPARSAMRDRLRALAAEHPAVHGDAAIKRLLS